MERKKKPKASKTIQIDCSKNKSINKALEDTAIELTIEIEGICTEDVLVRRDNVTLRGTDPAVDGIQAASNAVDTLYGAAILIREARNIRVENLQLNGGWTALRVENARRLISADNCTLQNATFGAVSLGGRLDMSNMQIMNNRRGVGASASAELTCIDCTISDNTELDGTGGTGIFLLTGATMTVVDSTISGSRTGVLLSDSTFFSSDTTLSTIERFAVIGTQNSTATLRQTSFDGSLFLQDHSQIEVSGSTQTANPLINAIYGNSSIRVTDDFTATGAVPSTLLSTLDINEFSNGAFYGGTTLGDLFCSADSNSTCQATVTKSSSSCALCP